MRQSAPDADRPSGPSAAALAVRGLSKVYGRHVWALRDVNADLSPGELTVVVGPSGSGKSTLLRLIAGLERPSAGEIWLGGRRVDRWPAHRRRVGMVFQRPVLLPQYSVRENLTRPGKVPHPWPLAEWCEQLGIGGLLDRHPDQLSGGELQRVAMARALVRRPDLLLLDEPFNHLDPPRRLEMRLWLSQVHKALGLTILLVSHEQLDALMLGQQLWVLIQGRLRQAGRPDEVYRQPADLEVAGLLGDAGLNQIAGRLEKGRGGSDPPWWFVRGGMRVALRPAERLPPRVADGQDVVLGVRPEDVRLVGAGETSHLVGRAERVDWFGSQSLVTVREMAEPSAAALELRALMPANEAVQLGATVGVVLGSDRLCLFGASRGENLQQIEHNQPVPLAGGPAA